MKKSLLFLVSGIASVASAQNVANLNNGSLNLYEQNFNSLGKTGSVAFDSGSQVMDMGAKIGSSMSGWYLVTSTTGTGTVGGRALTAGTGTNTVGGFYSFGAADDSDRALGTLGSGSFLSGSRILRLRNNTHAPITGVVEFRWFVEQWRASASTADIQGFDYSFQNGSYVLDPTDGLAGLGTGIWSRNNLNVYTVGGAPVDTTVAGGTYEADLGVQPVSHNVSAQVLGSGAAVDGNTFRAVRAGQITMANWAPGSDLLLRWTETDTSGSDQGFAIDDVKVVPEPATLAMFAIGLGGLVRKRRK